MNDAAVLAAARASIATALGAVRTLPADDRSRLFVEHVDRLSSVGIFEGLLLAKAWEWRADERRRALSHQPPKLPPQAESPLRDAWARMRGEARWLPPQPCIEDEWSQPMARWVGMLADNFVAIGDGAFAEHGAAMRQCADAGNVCQALAVYDSVCWGATYGAFYDGPCGAHWAIGPSFNGAVDDVMQLAIELRIMALDGHDGRLMGIPCAIPTRTRPHYRRNQPPSASA